MKLMKLSTNKILNKHFILQSLPLAVAAIALVLYLYTFLPLSVKRMEGSVALVERTYYMQLCINGKPIAYFNALNDSMLPVSLTHDLARLTPNRHYPGWEAFARQLDKPLAAAALVSRHPAHSPARR